MRPGAPLKNVSAIVVHHSLTQDTGTLSWHAIRKFHMEQRGWSDVGYHAGIENVRGGYLVVLGRPEDRTGAHTVGMNNRSLGFLFVGNYDLAEPSDEMLDVAARSWFVPVLARYGLGVRDILPHRQFANKTCPGARFNMDRLYRAIQNQM